MSAKDRWPELLESVSRDDGLPVRMCGAWTEKKLFVWHRYLEITTTAMVGSPHWREGLVYLDLFCGPGICEIRDTRKRLPGSPLIAAATRKAFRRIVLCELDQTLADACRRRMDATPAGGHYHLHVGDCNDSARALAAQIPSGTLTLAFIDPEALDVHFSTLQTLATGRAVDFLLLFADATDLVRNIALYSKQYESKLDRMLGPDSDWRKDVSSLGSQSGANLRELFPKIYERQIRKHLGYVGLRTQVVKGPNGPLYTLLYASKHERGIEFWDKISKKELGGQELLF